MEPQTRQTGFPGNSLVRLDDSGVDITEEQAIARKQLSSAYEISKQWVKNCSSYAWNAEMEDSMVHQKNFLALAPAASNPHPFWMRRMSLSYQVEVVIWRSLRESRRPHLATSVVLVTCCACCGMCSLRCEMWQGTLTYLH